MYFLCLPEVAKVNIRNYAILQMVHYFLRSATRGMRNCRTRSKCICVLAHCHAQVWSCTGDIHELTLPLSSGLPFHINANFVQPASREFIVSPDNSYWNQWLIEQIPAAWYEAFSSLIQAPKDIFVTEFSKNNLSKLR